MNINAQDIITLTTTFFYFLVISFALYLPILAIFKDQKKAVQLCISVSWATQILFGYIFYILGITNLYPLFYFPAILAANLIAYSILKKCKLEIFPKPKGKKWFYALLAFCAVTAIYYRFYDAMTIVGFGNPDTTAHLSMLEHIRSFGYIGNGYYAPGFHILLNPITHLVDNYGISRFAGPTIGLITLIGIYFLLKDRIKSSSSLFLIAILSFPLLEKFIIQTIGFFPTALTFILFATLIYLLTDTKINIRQYLVLNLIIILALAVTVPYFLIQYALFLVFLLVIFLLGYRKHNTVFPAITRKILISTAVVIIGFLVAFGHVELQTNILERGGGFPEIRTIQQVDGELLVSSNYADKEELKLECENSNNILKKKVICGSFYQSMIIPLVNTGLDLVKIKNILPINTAIYAFSYLVIIISLLLIFVSVRKKNLELLVLSAGTFCYGILTITGFFEMSDYRGRSGWYFPLLAIFLVVWVFNLLKDTGWALKLKYFTISLVLLFSVYLSIHKPMIFPRLYYPEIFSITRELSLKHSEKTALISNNHNLSMLGQNLYDLDYNKSSLNNDYPFTILLLEKNQFDKDAVYKGIVFAHNREVEKNDPEVLKLKNEEYARTQDILNSQELNNYTLYFENENVKVYTKSAN